MRIGTAIAIYFVIWWTVLFAVLPLKLTTQGEAGEVVPGTSASAPTRPRLALKAAITTVVAAVVFAGFLAVKNSGLGLDDIPFLPKFSGH
jgi:predicted secreted protein